MAGLIFFTGFDAFGGDFITNSATNWSVQSGDPYPVISNDGQVRGTTNPRNSQGGYLTGGSFGWTCYADLRTTYTRLICGFGFRCRESGFGAAHKIWYVADASGNIHLGLRVNTNGSLELFRGNFSTSLATSSAGAIPSGGSGASDWRFIEVDFTINSSSGSVTVKVEDSTVITYSGNTYNGSGTQSVQRVQIQNQDGWNNMYDFDDFYVLDPTGASSPENTFLTSAFRVLYKAPNADGAFDGEWTPSTGTSAAAVVDELASTSNVDTDYISSQTIGHRQTFTRSTNALTGTVLGVQQYAVMRKDDAATRKVSHLAYDGSTENTSNEETLGTTAKMYKKHWQQNPFTSARFTVAEVVSGNTVEFGVKVTA